MKLRYRILEATRYDGTKKYRVQYKGWIFWHTWASAWGHVREYDALDDARHAIYCQIADIKRYRTKSVTVLHPEITEVL